MTGKTAEVLFVIGSLEVGGTERQLVELCRRLDRGRWKPRVATLGPAGPLGDSLTEAGIEVRELRNRERSRGPRTVRRGVMIGRCGLALRGLLADRRPRVVHAYLPAATVVAAAALSGDASTPFVLAKRSLVRSVADSPFYSPLALYASARADLIQVNSEAVGREIVATENAPADKLRLVYNGVDTVRFRRGAERPRGQRLGMLANFIGYKGHIEVCRAFAGLAPRFPAATLDLWGRSGPALPEVFRFRADSGLENRIHIHGLAEDPAAALAGMDVFVSASHEEGFSNSILEAMASSLAIVATAVGGTVEQIENGVSGWLVPPGDADALRRALEEALGDSAEAARRAARARELCERRFSIEAMVAGTEAIYAELLPLQGDGAMQGDGAGAR